MSAPPHLMQGILQQQQPSRVKMVAGYVIQQKLGSGSFAVVYKGVKLQPTGGLDDCSAIKAIARTSEKLTKKVLQNLEVEISILRTYRHRNIVCMHDVQKTANHFYLILEYCAGGDVQGLIRSRKDARLSEGLTRRLMRDLAQGLKFLWGQQLIHRDIKPMNLLLTGPLPLDEIDDPEKTDDAEEQRRLLNFPTKDFCLKIADFGFARHLQTTSLAETLCGSPLYMAPEILQHHRYDAKADLWSVGTVLFEMIAGEPPFHGENHIDLLRNIQRKAVRLPKDVRVSKECVNLLRILLSRNPLTRAGFKEFFEACDAFVALGCQGLATIDEGSCKRPSIDLGTILENPSGPPLSESLMTVTTNAPSPQQALVKISTSLTPIAVSTTSAALTKPRSHMFSPLVPSPPTSSGTQMPSPSITEHPTISTKRSPQAIEMPTRRNDDGAIGLQNSADENSFVMVEHGSSVHKPPAESAVNSTAVVSHCGEAYKQDSRYRLEHSPPSSPGFLLNRIPVLPSRGDYMVVRQPKGMLSTSPGTGGALMGMAARPQLTAASNTNDSDKQLEWQIKAATKMLAAAEDVGRRAISVAHLGDKRAYFAMRMLMMNESSSSSILSATPMEGIEEESRDHDSGAVTDDGDSRSTEIMTSVRRRRSSTSIADKSMADIKAEDEADEMPFAMQSESAPPLSAGLPSRSTVSFNKDATISSSRPLAKPTPALIRSHFSEALACYLKALKMLKGAVGASKGVSIDSGRLAGFRLTPDQQNFTGQMRQRSEVTLNWLEDQFKGVLERGDAANTEIAKLPQPQNLSEQPALISIEELLYNHALGYGREGAVKQLLGHYEAARSCYRSAGLLAETLLMEPRIEGDDRKTLEGYVDGFAAQITELDEVLLQQSQSRLIASSSATSSYTSTRRGQPSVVSLVGNPFSMFSINK